MRGARPLIAAALLVAGCSAEPGDGPPSGEGGPPAPPDVGAPAPIDPPVLQRVATLAAAEPPLRERGVGVVFPVEPNDTLDVRAEPADAAPLIARLHRAPTGEYTLEAGPDAANGGAMDFSYEEVGLPLLEPAGTSPDAEGWMRVHYALDSAGAPMDGWVRADAERVGLLTWRDHLPTLPLFFLDADSIAFHAEVDGARLDIPLAPDGGQERFDYILHPLETRGEWMRAELVTPKDYCFDSPAPRRDTVWVRYLDEGGEPRLWYYTRGC